MVSPFSTPPAHKEIASHSATLGSVYISFSHSPATADTQAIFVDFKCSHPDLMAWLKPLSNIAGTHVSVGPRRSFFACVPSRTRGGFYYSPNIPVSLKNILGALPEDPYDKFTSQVSLGAGESWFILWPNGDISWDLAGQYEELKGILEELPEKCIRHLALNPWAAGQYFLSLEDGTVKYCLPSEWALEIETEILTWQNRFKMVTSSTVRGGRANSSMRVIGSDATNPGVLPVRNTPTDGAVGTIQSKNGHDMPPPYK